MTDPDQTIRISNHWLLLSAGFFAIAGAASRYAFQDVQTRAQILGAWGLAIALHVVLRRSRPRLGFTGLLLNGAAATVGILYAKFALEGFHWLR